MINIDIIYIYICSVTYYETRMVNQRIHIIFYKLYIKKEKKNETQLCIHVYTRTKSMIYTCVYIDYYYYKYIITMTKKKNYYHH